MKKTKIITLLFILFLLIGTSVTYAVDLSPLDNLNTRTDIDGKIDSIRGNAIAIMQVIGVSVAVVMLVVVAIKYMSSAPNDRAEVKKHLVPYAIGAIFIFGSVAIVQIIKGFAENAF